MLFNKTNKHSLAALGAFVACFLLSSAFSTTPASAYTASISTSSNISLDVSPSGDGTNIHSESINVVSDCRAGYNLTIATPSGSDLYQYANNTQAGTASFTAVDGTSALSSSSNTNKWGYTLTSNPTSSTVFSPLSSTSSTLKTPSETADPDNNINDTFNINYGIKVDSTITPGTYQMASQGAIVYYLTMDTTCIQYTVSFNANGGTIADGSTNPTQPIESGEPTKLLSSDSLSAPTTASYTDAGNNTINGDPDKIWTFWGWNTAIDGTGDWYKDKEEVEDLTQAGSTITLYAQWKQATLADLTTGTQIDTEKVIDHNLMQDMKPEICWNSEKFSAIGVTYGQAILKDSRDGTNRTYSVAKLPDGLCWMTQNLNLGSSTAITLTPDDTDLEENTTFTLSASNPNDLATESSQTNINKPTVLNDMTLPSYTVNSTTYSGFVSGYYSYAAATANTSTYDISTNFLEFTTSICPRNWDLPTTTQYDYLKTSGSINSYNNTDASFLGKNAGNEPYYFIYGGYRKAAGNEVNETYFYNPTSNGNLWTSTNYNSNYGRSANINTNGTATGYQYKYYGMGVRCVASQGKITINYDGNGTNEYPVTGSIPAQEGVEINNVKLRGNSFKRAGYAFNGWNTAADGSGISITSSDSISSLNFKPGDTITLYAQWIPQYTITYVNNCMSWASSDANCTASISENTSEQKINLDASGNGSGTLGAYDKYTLTGWKIKEWTTNADGTGTVYPISSTYSITGQATPDSITLYAHWIRAYSIQFDGNGASNANGMGTTNTTTGIKSIRFINVGEGEKITLLANNFKRANYGFAGWSTNPNATASSGDKIYGPMEVIDAPAYPASGASIVTFYAVWIPAEKDNNDNPLYLQDWNSCSSLTSASFDSATGEITAGSVIALTDKRDNQVYTVAKLADDNCWMIENLRLEAAATVGYNINDSSVTNESLAQGYSGTVGKHGTFVGLANSEPTSSWVSTTSNSIYKSSANPPIDTYDPINGTLEDIGTANNPVHRFPRYNNSNTQNSIDSTSYVRNYGNATKSTASGSYAGNIYSYGNFYSWNAAMANTNHYVGADTVDDDGKTSETVNTSICPKGWHLPSGSTSEREFNVLSLRYGGNGGNQTSDNSGIIMSRRFRAFPNNFVLSRQGADGRYWTRTSWNSTNGNVLLLGSTLIYTNEHYAKASYGYSVRCLMNP